MIIFSTIIFNFCCFNLLGVEISKFSLNQFCKQNDQQTSHISGNYYGIMSSSLAYPDFCDDKVRSHFSLFHFSRLCNTLMFEDLYVEILPTIYPIGSKRSNTIWIPTST